VSAVQGVEEQLRALAGKGKDLSLDRRARAQQEALQMVSGLEHVSMRRKTAPLKQSWRVRSCPFYAQLVCDCFLLFPTACVIGIGWLHRRGLPAVRLRHDSVPQSAADFGHGRGRGERVGHLRDRFG
jgi:hypothetical protein